MDYNKTPSSDKLKSSIETAAMNNLGPAVVSPPLKPQAQPVPLKIKTRQDFLK